MKLALALLLLSLSASASSVTAVVAIPGHGMKDNGDIETADGDRNVQVVAYDQTSNKKQYGASAVAVTGTGNITAGQPCQGPCNLVVLATVAVGVGIGVIDPIGASWRTVINPATQSFRDIQAHSGIYIYYQHQPAFQGQVVTLMVNGYSWGAMTPDSYVSLDASIHGPTPEIAFALDY